MSHHTVVIDIYPAGEKPIPGVSVKIFVTLLMLIPFRLLLSTFKTS